MPVLDTIAPWHVQPRLTAAVVDAWLREAGPHPGEVTLELGRWKSSQQFAEAALLGALSLWTRNGTRVRASVPPITLTGDRAYRIFGVADQEQLGNVTPSEKLLANTTAGLLLGHFADFGDDHHGIQRHQRQQLHDDKGIYGNGHERSQITLIDGNSPPRPYRSSYETRIAKLESVLSTLLKNVAPSKSARSVERLNDISPVVDFCFQAWDNARDHGELDLEGSLLRSARFLSVRRTDLSKTRTNKGSPIDDVIGEYVQQLVESLQHTKVDPSSVRLLEVTVADGGVGVPARMANTFDVYRGSLTHEHKILIEALRPKGTTKAASDHAGRGGGFPTMLDAAHQFHGLALYRTGRTLASRHFVGCRRVARLNVWENDSPAYEVDLNTEQLPLTGGTSATLICPLDMHIQHLL